MTGERILVVDDMADIRDIVINHILKPYAFDYMEATNGAEALERIKADPPDLILTDLQMPSMTGIDLIHRLREEKINIPVVLMTSHGSEDIAVEVFRLGVKDYVRKPFTEEELLEALELALTETRLRREQERLTQNLSSLNTNLLMHVEHLEALQKVGKELLAINDQETLLKHALEITTQTSHSQVARLLLYDGASGQLKVRAEKARARVKLLDQPVDDPLAAEVIAANISRIGEPQVDDSFEHFKVSIYVPLRAGETRGAVIVTQPADAVSEPLLHLLNAVAIYIAAALERIRLAALVGQ